MGVLMGVLMAALMAALIGSLMARSWLHIMGALHGPRIVTPLRDPAS